MNREEKIKLLEGFIRWGGFDTGEPAEDLAEEYLAEIGEDGRNDKER